MCESVAIHIEYEQVKSITVRLSLATCCNYPKGYQTSLTDSMARRYLSGALPFAYDDPENAELVKDS